MEEHNNYAVDYINATRWIKANLPHAKVSGGVSNISFSFRGNNKVREAMHSAFLYHAIAAGMDMGIVNAGMLEVYEEIEPELKELVEDVLLNRRPDATERLVDFGEKLKSEGTVVTEKKAEEWRRNDTVGARLSHALVKGIDTYIETDTEEARALNHKQGAAQLGPGLFLGICLYICVIFLDRGRGKGVLPLYRCVIDGPPPPPPSQRAPFLRRLHRALLVFTRPMSMPAGRWRDTERRSAWPHALCCCRENPRRFGALLLTLAWFRLALIGQRLALMQSMV